MNCVTNAIDTEIHRYISLDICEILSQIHWQPAAVGMLQDDIYVQSSTYYVVPERHIILSYTVTYIMPYNPNMLCYVVWLLLLLYTTTNRLRGRYETQLAAEREVTANCTYANMLTATL